MTIVTDMQFAVALKGSDCYQYYDKFGVITPSKMDAYGMPMPYLVVYFGKLIRIHQ